MKNCFVLFSLLLLAVHLPLIAQEQKEEEKNEKQETSQGQPPLVKEESVKLFLDKINVSGHLDRPQAIFIIPGVSPEIDDIQIERSFFKEIFRTVEKKGHVVSNPDIEQKNRDDYIPW